MRVLVIEDDHDIRKVIASYLEREGLNVVEAPDGLKGLELADQAPPDLVILDLMLPAMGGYEVMRRLRERGPVPIILVTARGEEADRVVGLELGADDYVVKPFSPRELVARVNAVLRRARPAPDGAAVHTFPGLTIDTGRRRVEVDGRPVELTYLEFELLSTLAATPGRVFTRAELLDRVWGPEFDGTDRVVDVHISGLRERLGDDSSSPRFLHTVRGVGYRFEVIE
jgi:DNA-binding response OmpR family regulator